MRSHLKLVAMTATIIALAASITQAHVSHGLSWERATNGNVPENALIAGREADGQVLFLCRAKYRGGVHPGKVRAEFRGCNIPWGGKEISIPEYEVLVR